MIHATLTLTVPTAAGPVVVCIPYDADAHEAYEGAITALEDARNRLLWRMGDATVRDPAPPARRPASLVAALLGCLAAVAFVAALVAYAF